MTHFPVDASLPPYQALAAAVIRLALHDARLREARGEGARRFLSGSDGLTFWCDVASVPTAMVMARAKLLVPGLDLAPQARAA